MYIPCELVAQAIKIQANTGIDRTIFCCRNESSMDQFTL